VLKRSAIEVIKGEANEKETLDSSVKSIEESIEKVTERKNQNRASNRIINDIFKLKHNPKATSSNPKLTPKQPSSGLPDLEPWLTFAQLNLSFVPSGKMIAFGEHLYVAPIGLPDLHGIKVVRPGWYIGALRKNRFEPAHALAMGITADEALRTIKLASSDPRVIRYLKGETLEVDEQGVERIDDAVSAKGYVLVCVDGFPLGWGKWLDGIVKNEYPAGWRWT
jgi:NOL1/NOP2/fmu family ribosome biogenesis protein